MGEPEEPMDRMRTGLEHRLRRAVRQIGEQHRHLRQLDAEFDRAVRESALDALSTWLERYAEALRAHFALEEEVIFPALHGLDTARATAISRLELDHGHLLETLDLMRGPDGPERLPVELPRLRERLRDHERREEELMETLIG